MGADGRLAGVIVFRPCIARQALLVVHDELAHGRGIAGRVSTMFGQLLCWDAWQESI